MSWNLTAIRRDQDRPQGRNRRRPHHLAAELGPLRRRGGEDGHGATWVADLRDSLVAHPHRRAESMAVRAKEKVDEGVARLVARSADAITCVSEAIAEEARGFSPKEKVVAISNGCDFDDFAGLDYTPGEPLPDHAHRAASSASATRARS